MSSGIEEDDYDSERDILIIEELLDNYSLSLPENESFHFDTPSSSYKTTRCIPGNLKTLAKGFCLQVFISPASLENHVSKSNRANIYLMAYFINDLRFTKLPFKTSRTMFSSSMAGIFDLIVHAAVVTT
nr:hypothetical protein [Tanacetum cinerariifolium]